MSLVLQWASGLAALAAAGLVAVRVLGAPSLDVMHHTGPAIYSPVTTDAKLGDVSVVERPGDGFILVVETVPEGALLQVDGVERGETPASLNFDCPVGKKAQVRLSREGFAPVERSIACKADVMVVVKATLKRKLP